MINIISLIFITEKEKVRFHNIKIVDTMDIVVMVFLSQNDINYYMETNSMTNDK